MLVGDVIDSPIGSLTIAMRAECLAEIRFGIKWDGITKNSAAIQEVSDQLDEYFAKVRTEFTIPLAPRGTDFQKSVWMLLSKIPYGETRCYADLAEELKNPQACRAVGAANGRNPIPIIVPCHRVIGRSGALTGFAGGIPVKRFLLDLESPTRKTRELFDL